jgi:hypothetical protein
MLTGKTRHVVPKRLPEPEKQAIRNRGQFVPGQSGNPLGKAAGNRDTLTRAFIRDLTAVYEERGREVLENLAEHEPGVFMRIIASLVPKEIDVAETQRIYLISDRPMTPEEWAAYVGAKYGDDEREEEL